jgi:hypothetical protein
MGVIEPDKVAELGYAYLQLYELSGNVRYLDAATACADALAHHIRDGDETHSPWPFRVYAATNVIREEFTSNVVGALLLFDGISKHPSSAANLYRRARAAALHWLLRVPVKNDVWSGYFEDIAIQPEHGANRNQYSALRTAQWLMAHRTDDAQWREHAAHLIDWAIRIFGGDTANEPGSQWGATVMSEQTADMAKMGSHTARLGATSALWYEATGDIAARERAARSLNWATYMCDDRGVVAVSQEKSEGYWFSDGYGDYVRHFLTAMGAVPEWAPSGENHILRSTSIVRNVDYSRTRIVWSTYDAEATETLRLGARPVRITVTGHAIGERQDCQAEGFVVRPLPSGGVVVRVHHASTGPVVLTPAD